jgi:hypothetical protein
MVNVIVTVGLHIKIRMAAGRGIRMVYAIDWMGPL